MKTDQETHNETHFKSLLRDEKHTCAGLRKFVDEESVDGGVSSSVSRLCRGCTVVSVDHVTTLPVGHIGLGWLCNLPNLPERLMAPAQPWNPEVPKHWVMVTITLPSVRKDPSTQMLPS